MKIVHCKNRQCRAEIGQSDGGIYYRGISPVRVLVCCNCGREHKTRASQKPKELPALVIGRDLMSLSLKIY